MFEGMEFRVRMVLGQDLGMTERQGFGHGRLLRLAMVCIMVRAVSLGLRSVGLERKGVRVRSVRVSVQLGGQVASGDGWFIY